MSMQHPKSREWDKKLKMIFDEIDDYLEDKYGHMYPLHPNRAARGETASKSQDGLFSVGASFSPGFGSKLGRGYVLDVYMSTLNMVPAHVREQIIHDTVRVLNIKLDEYFPDRELSVEKDGNVFKIHGDLSLGTL